MGSLKQVLSGVKTRGILGEVQLGAILKEILAPGQYAENVATVPGSSNRVEYAVKLPGQSGTVWLPVDAKFPGDTYAHLQDAQSASIPRMFFPVGWKRQPEEGGIGPGCCGGGVITTWAAGDGVIAAGSAV